MLGPSWLRRDRGGALDSYYSEAWQELTAPGSPFAWSTTDVREHKKGTLVATRVAIHVVGNDDVPAVLYDALSLYQG